MNPKIDINHICALANLKLTDKEKKHLALQMIKIIQWVGKLEELEFEASEEEVYSSVSFSTPFREDRVQPSFPAEEAAANSPEKDKGFITVPRVIEEK